MASPTAPMPRTRGSPTVGEQPLGAKGSERESSRTDADQDSPDLSSRAMVICHTLGGGGLTAIVSVKYVRRAISIRWRYLSAGTQDGTRYCGQSRLQRVWGTQGARSYYTEK